MFRLNLIKNHQYTHFYSGSTADEEPRAAEAGQQVMPPPLTPQSAAEGSQPPPPTKGPSAPSAESRLPTEAIGPKQRPLPDPGSREWWAQKVAAQNRGRVDRAAVAALAWAASEGYPGDPARVTQQEPGHGATQRQRDSWEEWCTQSTPSLPTYTEVAYASKQALKQASAKSNVAEEPELKDLKRIGAHAAGAECGARVPPVG
jgi:hypothetical protein